MVTTLLDTDSEKSVNILDLKLNSSENGLLNPVI